MRKLFSIALAVMLAFSPVIAYASFEDECTPNGCSQSALVQILYQHQEALNLLSNAGVLQTHGILLDDPILAAGTTNGKAKTTAAISYSIDGVLYNKAATDDFCDATGLTDLTDDYTKILFTIKADGGCTVTDATHGASQAAVSWPAIPDNEIVLGGLTLGDGTAHDFDVDALTANGGTFVDPASITSAVLDDVGDGTASDPVVRNSD